MNQMSLWSRIREEIGYQVRRLTDRGVVATGGAGLVTITRVGAATTDTEQYAHLDGGGDLQAGDEVIGFRVGGQTVWAKLVRETPSRRTMLVPLTIQQDSGVALQVGGTTGSDVLRVDTISRALRLFDQTFVRIYNAGSTEYTLNLHPTGGGGSSGLIQVRDGAGANNAQIQGNGDARFWGNVDIGNAPGDRHSLYGEIFYPTLVGTMATIAVGSAAGTGATAAIFGNHNSGRIQLTTGSNASSLTGLLFTITWPSARISTAYAVVLQAADPDSASDVSKVYFDEATRTTTTGEFRNRAGGALLNNTTYIWTYHAASY